eukprot:362428-Lingulodinium_polyedra.AAC.1
MPVLRGRRLRSLPVAHRGHVHLVEEGCGLALIRRAGRDGFLRRTCPLSARPHHGLHLGPGEVRPPSVFPRCVSWRGFGSW